VLKKPSERQGPPGSVLRVSTQKTTRTKKKKTTRSRGKKKGDCLVRRGRSRKNGHEDATMKNFMKQRKAYQTKLKGERTCPRPCIKIKNRVFYQKGGRVRMDLNGAPRHQKKLGGEKDEGLVCLYIGGHPTGLPEKRADQVDSPTRRRRKKRSFPCMR